MKKGILSVVLILGAIPVFAANKDKDKIDQQTTVSIADKKYELDQLRIASALNGFNAAQAQAQLQYNNAMSHPQTTLAAAINQVMDDIGFPKEGRDQWNYDPVKMEFVKKTVPVQGPISSSKNTPVKGDK